MDSNTPYTSSSTDFSIDEEIKEPCKYSVILFNDDYTTKEYVVSVLMMIYHKAEEEAINLMETVHQKGSAIVGVYSYDIAATMTSRTIQDARANGFPLRCKMEQA